VLRQASHVTDVPWCVSDSTVALNNVLLILCCVKMTDGVDFEIIVRKISNHFRFSVGLHLYSWTSGSGPITVELPKKKENSTEDI
jgi:hypothetical protein